MSMATDFAGANPKITDLQFLRDAKASEMVVWRFEDGSILIAQPTVGMSDGGGYLIMPLPGANRSELPA
jgi:hypothetical protein